MAKGRFGDTVVSINVQNEITEYTLSAATRLRPTYPPGEVCSIGAQDRHNRQKFTQP